MLSDIDAPLPNCDDLLSSAIRAAMEAGKPLSRRQLVRLLRDMHGYRLTQAIEIVKDYDQRYHVLPERLPPTRWSMTRGCIALLLVALFVGGTLYGMVVGTPHHTASPAPSPAWMLLVKYGWAALLTAVMVRDLRGKGLRQALTVLRQIRPGTMIQNIVVILITIGCALLLYRLFPFLNRSWLYLLPGSGGHATNLNVWPATIKYFGFFFLVLLALNLPALARVEEEKYRRGTQDWRDALGRSVRFGLAHCWVGVPLYAGLALTVGGLWFTLQYFRGGVERSMLHHTTYNLTVVVVLFMVLLLGRL